MELLLPLFGVLVGFVVEELTDVPWTSDLGKGLGGDDFDRGLELLAEPGDGVCVGTNDNTDVIEVVLG